MTRTGVVWLALLAISAFVGTAAAEPLRVVASVPDLASLAREVGGEEVAVSELVAGPQDAHFVEARPSFIRELSRADVFVHVGLDLEVAWAPPLVRNARNTRILPGAAGDFDASQGIPRLGAVRGQVDRSQGDVHPYGSPHYLLDPVMGLVVAGRLAERFAQLRPQQAELFRARARAFEEKLLGHLIGESLLRELGVARVAEAARSGQLERLLAGTPEDRLGGWLAALAPWRGQAVVADHDLWPYFAQRFGLRVVAFLEPKPGVTPTTRHLSEVAEQMRTEGIGVVLCAPYFHPRYAQKISEATGARVLEMAHQVGARAGASDYIEMVQWNVQRLADAR